MTCSFHFFFLNVWCGQYIPISFEIRAPKWKKLEIFPEIDRNMSNLCYIMVIRKDVGRVRDDQVF